ncbi:hypothetical protein IWZ00DRAFT_189764 [Phyllosticta capitalensis]
MLTVYNPSWPRIPGARNPIVPKRNQNPRPRSIQRRNSSLRPSTFPILLGWFQCRAVIFAAVVAALQTRANVVLIMGPVTTFAALPSLELRHQGAAADYLAGLEEKDVYRVLDLSNRGRLPVVVVVVLVVIVVYEGVGGPGGIIRGIGTQTGNRMVHVVDSGQDGLARAEAESQLCVLDHGRRRGGDGRKVVFICLVFIQTRLLLEFFARSAEKYAGRRFGNRSGHRRCGLQTGRGAVGATEGRCRGVAGAGCSVRTVGRVG